MTEMEKKMLQQREEIKDLRMKSELQINAITVNYEQRLDKLRAAIGRAKFRSRLKTLYRDEMKANVLVISSESDESAIDLGFSVKIQDYGEADTVIHEGTHQAGRK